MNINCINQIARNRRLIFGLHGANFGKIHYSTSKNIWNNSKILKYHTKLRAAQSREKLISPALALWAFRMESTAVTSNF